MVITFIDINGKGTGVSLFTNEHYAPIDGDYHTGYIEGIGKVYSHSVTWRNFRILHTTNDSINRIIALGLARLITLETENRRRVSPPVSAISSSKSGQSEKNPFPDSP